MVSIIKNQLLKHLSRFTKNLSADKINLSTFKGEGELKNLELNEEVLTDLLELPSWLRLTKARSNKVSFRVQWTKLKSVPIVLSLDEVNITVETCEELRPMSPQAGLSSYAAVPGKYSFIHKVIDGITVTVNTVNIVFNSPAFTATVQVSRILLESRDPKWRKCDLRMSRLKEPDKGQLLIFKELTWQTVRIEAKSTKDSNLTPIRLLTNQAWCRITIKKRLADCFIIGSRMVVILDDLLWVLTDSQLKAALKFVDSLAGLVQKSTLLARKVKAARKLEELPEYQAQVAQQSKSHIGHSNAAKVFSKFDVVETSYHFVTQHIVLHLCDDVGDGRSCHPHFKEGGALQITVNKFKVDYYPYHLAKSDRKHWPGYREEVTPHVQWFIEAMSKFRTELLDLVGRNKTQHTPLSRSAKPNDQGPEGWTVVHSEPKANQLRDHLLFELSKLMTSCMIVRLDDFTIYKVTTPTKRPELKVFISGDKDRISLPENSNILHAEFIYFYYPSDTAFPLPPPKFYVHANPIQIYFDVDTCLWLNSFGLTLYQSLLSSKQQASSSDITYVDVKIEAILPKIIFESAAEYPNQRDRPKSLHFNVTRATITNVRNLQQSSRADLAKCVESFHSGSLFFGSDFPSKSGDFYLVTQKFLDHITTNDNVRNTPEEMTYSSVNALMELLSRELFWRDAKDVWNIHLEPVWGDFLGAKAVGSNKPVPFLDTVPVTIWLHTCMDPNSTVKSEENNGAKHADIHALTYISTLISVQLNHYQYLFLLRLAEEVAEMTTFLSLDSNKIMKTDSMGSLIVGAVIPQVEVTFVMPSQCPGKESSGGDVESFVPDSSSIPDDMPFQGSSATIFPHRDLTILENEYKERVPNGVGNRSIGKMKMNINMKGIRPDYFNNSKSDIAEPQMDTGSYVNPITTPTTTRYQGSINSSTKISENFNAVVGPLGFSSMKKSLKSMIESTMKPSMDDASETMSIKSDVSSDSDNLEVISVVGRELEIEDAMFYVDRFEENKQIEVASEVEEDSLTTISERSYTSSYRRRDLVSVATFKLNKVEFIQQSNGFSSSIKVQVGNMSSDECSSIPWDEFQTKFNSRTKVWSEIFSNRPGLARIKLRLDHTLKIDPDPVEIAKLDFSDKDIQRKLFDDFLSVQANGLNLTLCMSVVTGLADFFEDEIYPIPLPMVVSLKNIALHLNEDRPPTNITSPGPIPIDLNITELFIKRNEDGVFHIEPMKINKENENASISNEVESLRSIVQELQLENKDLRRHMETFEQVSKENMDLHRYKEEYESMRHALIMAESKVTEMDEKYTKLLAFISPECSQCDGNR
ncbi:UHRF1-binding protein 1-like isoform X3 [Agrilus planipennis]|uniref:UHRF1-binding protein 1-like isoform X3 n=1 Tax=Agrilus planipennis TaxID=224129 RepID=A0A7F5RGA1_AGRPL|nr:UHRF1-binding protein 1-like isoform X3 [Agrilus planipennis]